jgi:methionine-rich copper-binding protein CopC
MSFPRKPLWRHVLRGRAALLLLAIPLLSGARSVSTAHGAPMLHLQLEKSDPADSSVVTAPDSLRLWFSQRTELSVTRVMLKNASGTTLPLGALVRGAAADAPVTAPVTGALAPGAYSVDWRTMAADGHVVRGTIRFTVKPAAP